MVDEPNQGIPEPEGHAELIETDYEIGQDNIETQIGPFGMDIHNPVFLIYNLAVGGFFPGPVSPFTTFPQQMAIDYVRVYQAPDTAERWEASFTDDFVGWHKVDIPFSAFERSSEQPAGAPDDGLGLEDVWGYGFRLPDAGSAAGRVVLDQVRLTAP